MKAYGIGRLTKDVEIRMTTSGKKLASFTLACRRTKEITDYVSCVAWEQRAELLQTYTHKGSKIFVEGDVNTRNYDDPNFSGRKVYVTEINVTSIQLCDAKPETRETAVPIPEYTPQVNPQDVEVTADDLPF